MLACSVFRTLILLSALLICFNNAIRSDEGEEGVLPVADRTDCPPPTPKNLKKPTSEEMEAFNACQNKQVWEGISAFIKTWTESGKLQGDPPVLRFESLAAFRKALPFSNSPWQEVMDKHVDTDNVADIPLEGSQKLSDVIPRLRTAPFLYHGGSIKYEWFGDGVDFDKSIDVVTGPTFFVTHNEFLGAWYGGKGWHDFQERHCDGPCYWNGGADNNMKVSGYGQILQLTVENPDCVGLVPSFAKLNELAQFVKEKGTAAVTQWVKQQCHPKECSFLAVNWNIKGEQGAALLPYEFRLLPGSMDKCGLKYNKIVMVKMGSPYEEQFLIPAFDKKGDMAKAEQFLNVLKAIIEG